MLFTGLHQSYSSIYLDAHASALFVDPDADPSCRTTACDLPRARRLRATLLTHSSVPSSRLPVNAVWWGTLGELAALSGQRCAEARTNRRSARGPESSVTSRTNETRPQLPHHHHHHWICGWSFRQSFVRRARPLPASALRWHGSSWSDFGMCSARRMESSLETICALVAMLLCCCWDSLRDCKLIVVRLA
jgi:hypothetical protein